MSHPNSTLAVQGLQLGTASKTITPDAGSELCGFIARTEPMQGTHDDLQVKVMVWAEDAALTNAAALVTFDLIDLEADMVASIRQQAEALTGISAERIGVTCTHTHGGPSTMPERRLGQADPAYLDRTATTAATAIAEAAASLEPWCCSLSDIALASAGVFADDE